ncbi:MAG: hypothetical protein WA913_01430 [Pricia sp.]
MKLTTLYLIVAIFSLVGCKSQRYSAQELPDEQILFGKGGGMAGAEDTYILLENGQLFHQNSLSGTTEELESVPEKRAQEFFGEADQINLSQMAFDRPGNFYHFLGKVDGESKNRMVWDASGSDAPASCTSLYKQLIAALNESRSGGNNN